MRSRSVPGQIDNVVYHGLGDAPAGMRAFVEGGLACAGQVPGRA
jgi:hypothetical protein